MKLQNWLFKDLDEAKTFAKSKAVEMQDWTYIYGFQPDSTFPHQDGMKWIVQTYLSHFRKGAIPAHLIIKP